MSLIRLLEESSHFNRNHNFCLDIIKTCFGPNPNQTLTTMKSHHTISLFFNSNLTNDVLPITPNRDVRSESASGVLERTDQLCFLWDNVGELLTCTSPTFTTNKDKIHINKFL